MRSTTEVRSFFTAIIASYTQNAFHQHLNDAEGATLLKGVALGIVFGKLFEAQGYGYSPLINAGLGAPIFNFILSYAISVFTGCNMLPAVCSVTAAICIISLIGYARTSFWSAEVAPAQQSQSKPLKSATGKQIKSDQQKNPASYKITERCNVAVVTSFSQAAAYECGIDHMFAGLIGVLTGGIVGKYKNMRPRDSAIALSAVFANSCLVDVAGRYVEPEQIGTMVCAGMGLVYLLLGRISNYFSSTALTQPAQHQSSKQSDSRAMIVTTPRFKVIKPKSSPDKPVTFSGRINFLRHEIKQLTVQYKNNVNLPQQLRSLKVHIQQFESQYKSHAGDRLVNYPIYLQSCPGRLCDRRVVENYLANPLKIDGRIMCPIRGESENIEMNASENTPETLPAVNDSVKKEMETAMKVLENRLDAIKQELIKNSQQSESKGIDLSTQSRRRLGVTH